MNLPWFVLLVLMAVVHFLFGISSQSFVVQILFVMHLGYFQAKFVATLALSIVDSTGWICNRNIAFGGVPVD